MKKKVQLRLHLDFSLFETKIMPSPRRYFGKDRANSSTPHVLTAAQLDLWRTISGANKAVWLTDADYARDVIRLGNRILQKHDVRCIVETPHRLQIIATHEQK